MEREVDAEGAHSVAEIDTAVKGVWAKIIPDFCRRVSARVRRNLPNVIKLQGGNFYDEGKLIEEL